MPRAVPQLHIGPCVVGQEFLALLDSGWTLHVKRAVKQGNCRRGHPQGAGNLAEGAALGAMASVVRAEILARGRVVGVMREDSDTCRLKAAVLRSRQPKGQHQERYNFEKISHERTEFGGGANVPAFNESIKM